MAASSTYYYGAEKPKGEEKMRWRIEHLLALDTAAEAVALGGIKTEDPDKRSGAVPDRVSGGHFEECLCGREWWVTPGEEKALAHFMNVSMGLTIKYGVEICLHTTAETIERLIAVSGSAEESSFISRVQMLSLNTGARRTEKRGNKEVKSRDGKTYLRIGQAWFEFV